jgi:hypothetical protein
MFEGGSLMQHDQCERWLEKNLPLYPEHEKLIKVSDKRFTLNEFVEWLERRSILVCIDNGDPMKYVPIGYVPLLVDEFLGLNHEELKKEQKLILKNQKKVK